MRTETCLTFFLLSSSTKTLARPSLPSSTADKGNDICAFAAGDLADPLVNSKLATMPETSRSLVAGSATSISMEPVRGSLAPAIRFTFPAKVAAPAPAVSRRTFTASPGLILTASLAGSPARTTQPLSKRPNTTTGCPAATVSRASARLSRMSPALGAVSTAC